MMASGSTKYLGHVEVSKGAFVATGSTYNPYPKNT